MIVYVDVKNGKVDLTKDQLEKLLKQKYDEGYNDGKKFCGSVTYTTCPYSYWSCPYHWTNQPSITWTSSNSSSDNTITCTSSDQTISTSGYINTTGTVTLPKTETTSASATSSGLKIKYKEVD